MSLTASFAKDFAQHWIKAWNTKDIDAIMTHYAEEVVFSSPLIITTQTNLTGILKGKAALSAYFTGALQRNPDLQFDLQHTMLGVRSITLLYMRSHTTLAAETMILNEQGLIIEGCSHYPCTLTEKNMPAI
jgi:ketosteroid isomerase-like protein